jgi:hypothetical protein
MMIMMKHSVPKAIKCAARPRDQERSENYTARAAFRSVVLVCVPITTWTNIVHTVEVVATGLLGLVKL